MPSPDSSKQERMHIRLDHFSKQKLEKAAAYSHKSLSEFVLSQALNSADEVIQQQESLALSATDWQVFLDALENPPKPNTKLKRAFKLHAKHVAKK